jgi:hypothetical protein
MLRLSMRSSPVRMVVDSPGRETGAAGSIDSFLPSREKRFLKGEGARADSRERPRSARGS